MKTLSFQIPDEVYDALAQVAARHGRDAEQEAVHWLARQGAEATPRARRARLRAFEQHFGEWNTGHADAGDNEPIEADLLRAVAAPSPRSRNARRRAGTRCCSTPPA